MWAEQLAGGHRLFFTLLTLPELQQGLEHMEAVVNGTQAEQGRCCGIGNQRGRLEDRERNRVQHIQNATVSKKRLLYLRGRLGAGLCSRHEDTEQSHDDQVDLVDGAALVLPGNILQTGDVGEAL